MNDFVFTGTTNATLVGLRLTPETASLAPGTARQLTAEALYSNGTSQVVNAEADWASSNPAAVTVSDSGLVSAVAPGAATTEATFGGFSDTATITVTDVALTGLSVTPETPNIVLGNTLQLTASATFSDSTISNVTGQSTWASSDEAIATVDQNGLVSPVAVGPVTITATFGGQSDSALVTVSAAPLDPPVATSLSFATQPGNSIAGEIVFPTVTVEVLDQYGARLDTDATITLFFDSNPTGASLAGRSVAAVNGLATFSALSVDRPGTGYTLVATGAGLNPVSSDPFNVNLTISVFNLFRESPAIPAQANPDQGGNSSTRWSDTADFNNDGRLDAVTLVGSANQIRVHLRQDDGRFSPLDLTVTDASALAAGDLDGDGNADLLVVRRGANRKTVYLGNGDGTFNTPTDSVAPAGVNDIRLVEATGDSLPDLVIAAENLDRMYLFENNGTSTVFNDVRDAEFTLTGDAKRSPPAISTAPTTASMWWSDWPPAPTTSSSSTTTMRPPTPSARTRPSPLRERCGRWPWGTSTAPSASTSWSAARRASTACSTTGTPTRRSPRPSRRTTCSRRRTWRFRPTLGLWPWGTSAVASITL